MANDQIGLSFLPTPGVNGQRAGEGPAGGRLEDILRVLSFRLPKVLGAHAIAPEELLNSPGGSMLPSGGGTGGDPLADIITRTIIGRIGNMPGMPTPSIPSPAPDGMGGMGGGGAANPAGSFSPGLGPLSAPPKPRIIPIENPPPGGTAGPNPPGIFPGMPGNPGDPNPGDHGRVPSDPFADDLSLIRRQMGGRRPGM